MALRVLLSRRRRWGWSPEEWSSVLLGIVDGSIACLISC